MASLILPRAFTVAVTYEVLNYFMTAPGGGIALDDEGTNIGPGVQSWQDDEGATITEFAVNVSTPAPGTEYAYQLIVDGQVQEEGLITDVTNTVLELTSDPSGTIPADARIVFTIFQVVTTYS